MNWRRKHDYRVFFKTTDGEILLQYDTGKNDEERKQNFINAAAEAEVKTGITLLVNEEGRRRIDEAKAKYSTTQFRLL